MKILITGGAGFIGSHLVEHFHRRAEVRILDNLRSGHRDKVAGFEGEFIEGSVLDCDLVREAVKGVDLVYHLAAFVSVPDSVQNPQACNEINVTGTLNLLEASADAGVGKFCFSSSAAVYGNTSGDPICEDAPLSPFSPYAQSKITGESYCDRFSVAGRLQTVALRFFNVFGPRQNYETAYAAAVPIFMRQANDGTPISIYGDGLQTRDFVFVKDVVGALAFVGTMPGITGTFNTGYGTSISILELARRILSLTGSQSAICHFPARVGDVRHSSANTGKLRAAGFLPAGSLDDGLKETIEAFRSAKLQRSNFF